jgi:hypothetical protein
LWLASTFQALAVIIVLNVEPTAFLAKVTPLVRELIEFLLLKNTAVRDIRVRDDRFSYWRGEAYPARLDLITALRDLKRELT